MAKPLADRLKAALSANARASDVSQLIEIVDGELSAATAEQAKFHAIAIDVGSSDTAADEAADAELKAARRITRLTGQREQLTARLAELADAERRRENEAAWAIVMAERDQLAADLAAEWPLIEAKIQSFLWRISLSDKKIGSTNTSAEAIARGCPAGFNHQGTPIQRLTQLTLPSFNFAASAFHPAWPPHHREFDQVMIHPYHAERVLTDAADRVRSLEAAHAE